MNILEKWYEQKKSQGRLYFRVNMKDLQTDDKMSALPTVDDKS